MNNIDQKLYEHILDVVHNNEIAWLITVVFTDGSTPGKIGMKMLLKNNREFIGTIGGGAIEKLVIDKILSEKFIESTTLYFDLGSDSKFIKTGMICGGQQGVFIEPLFSNNRLYIIGGGHCGQALTDIMSKVNFSVTVIDERAEWTLPEKHPLANKIIQAKYNDIANYISFSPDTFIVIMTHSHSLDEKLLQELLNREYKYLGIIGSKNKSSSVLDKLKQQNVPLNLLQKIFIPIGFNLGSVTPYEIAISIAAQILAVKNSVTQIIFNSNPLVGEN